jgi:predicted site-specific integrase-resolvase
MKPTVLPRRALKKAAVCQRLDVSSPIFDRLVREGRLRVFYVTPSSVRVLPEDLEEFINASANIPPKQAFAVV